MEHLSCDRLVLATLLTEKMTPTSQPPRSGGEKVVGMEAFLNVPGLMQWQPVVALNVEVIIPDEKTRGS